ncbi:MAG: PH domain-containing protein [Streptomycetales bacterium]
MRQQPGDDSAESGRPLVYRSTSGLVAGTFCVVIGSWMAIDALLQGKGRLAVTVALAVVLAALIVFLLVVRPAVVADDRRVVLRNPLRCISIPWRHVTAIRARHALDVQAGERTYHSWAVVASGAARRRAVRHEVGKARRAGRSGGSHHPGAPTQLPYVEVVVGELVRMWERHREDADGEIVVTRSWPWIAALLGAAAALAAAVALG